jgi:PAS domain S-box-containing protein
MESPGPATKRHLAYVEAPPHQPWGLRYGLALFATACAWGISVSFRLEAFAPLPVLLLVAVTISTWFGGWKPGLVSTVLGFAVGIFTLIPSLDVLRANGSVNVMRLAAFLLGALLICRMNAGLRRAQEEVRYSQAHLAGVVQISEDAIISVDEAQRIRLFNHGAEKIFGYRAEDVLGKNLDLLLPKRHAEAHRFYMQKFMASPDALRSMNERATIHGLRRDGSEFPAEASISKFEVAGEKIMTVRLRDVTERIRTENVLRLNEKLAATGRLAATIAHEINNPLESVTNLLFLLEYHANLDETARQYVATASAELARVVHIARQTLGFYRDSSSPVPVKLSGLLQDVLDLYSRKAESRNIQVVSSFECDTVVEGFPGELRQIFSNLVANALEAMGRDGKVRVHLYRSHLWRHGSDTEGVRITIADNGPGISGEFRQKIFEPFFTTKSEKGTGLGLWVARGIVQKHGGAIGVYTTTRAGRSGTCFSVFLPVNAHVVSDRSLEARAA